MSENTKNPLMAPEKPKKRHLWGLWIPLIVIFSLIVVPVGIAAILFYDAHHVDTGISGEPTDSSKAFGSIMTNMFDGCRKEEDQTIDITISQKDLNQLLYNATYSVTQDPNSPLKQFSVEIKNDGKYIFDLEISAFTVLKTHLVLEATVSDDDVLPSGEKGFLFNITNMKVGRLSGLQSVLPWLMNTTGMDFSSIFIAAGLHITFDIDHLQLVYPYDAFADDLAALAKSSDPLFINIFTNFFTQGMLNFEHEEDVAIKGSIPMETFKENPAYTNSDYLRNPVVSDTPFLTYASNQVQSMIDAGIIVNDANASSNARTVIKFLAFGYDDYLNTEEQAYINSIYSSIKADYCQNLEIADYSAWARNLSIGETKSDLINEVAAAVSAKVNGHEAEYLTPLATPGGSSYIYDSEDPYVIPDSEIQTLLKGNKALIGYGYSFVGQDNNGNAKVSYTILDNVYPTIIPAKTDDLDSHDVMALTFTLNINGTETSLVMPMNGEEIHDGNTHGLSFNLKDAQLYFGVESFPNLKDQLQGIINGISSSSDDMIEFEKNPETNNIEHIKMKLDFDKYFNDPEHATSAFKVFHETATSAPYNAELVVDFEFASASTDAPSKRSGLVNVSVGYERPL